MPRIDSLGEAAQFHVPDRKKAQKKERTGWRSFGRMVEEAEESGSADVGSDGEAPGEGLAQLLDEVFAAGDQLKSSPTLDSVRGYRQQVKRFLRWVVERMVDVEETTSGVNIMKRKRFTLVRVIDEKLEGLAASVLSTQREQLDILAQVDEINGMLVDLTS